MKIKHCFVNVNILALYHSLNCCRAILLEQWVQDVIAPDLQSWNKGMNKVGNKYAVKPFSVTVDPCNFFFLSHETKGKKKIISKIGN